jgi:Tol biopolymer transport system component
MTASYGSCSRDNGGSDVLGRRTLAEGSAAAVAIAAIAVVLLVPSRGSAAPQQSNGVVRGSVTDSGAQSPHGSGDSAISGDGRYQIFESDSNLQPSGPGVTCLCGTSGTSQTNVGMYVRDLKAGHTNLVSIGKSANNTVEAPNNDTLRGSISEDGRYVAFATSATNVDPTYTPNQTHIVVCDRGAPDSSGVYAAAPAAGQLYPSTFHCITVGDPGFASFQYQAAPRLSADGSRIVWASRTSGGYFTLSTATLTYSNTGALTGASGVQSANFNGDYFPAATGESSYFSVMEPAVSADGDWIVVAVQKGYSDGDNAIMEADMRGSTPVVQRVDVATTGTTKTFVGNSTVTPGHPAVSGDGTVVAYDTDRDEVNGTDNAPDVYATKVNTGAFDPPAGQTTSASTSPAAASLIESGRADGTAPAGDADGDGAFPALSEDGTYLGFVTDRSGMYANSPAGSRSDSCLAPVVGSGPSGEPPPPPPPPSRTYCQVVARDLVADAGRRTNGQPLVPAHLASWSATVTTCPAPDGRCAGNGNSENPVSLSKDGAQVSFDSLAPDLVENDTNAATDPTEGGLDTFVRTWTPTITATTPVFNPIKLGRDETANLTVTDEGFGPYQPGNVTITGTNPNDFTVTGNTCEAAALRDGATCSLTVDFAPTAKGTRSATLSLYPAGDDTTPTLTRTLTGSVSASPPRPLAPGDTTRTSVTNAGGKSAQGGGDSVISGNGRYDVFVSTGNLSNQEPGPNATKYRKIFVRDLAAPQHTVQISLGGNPGGDLTKAGKPGAVAVDGDSYLPSISDDGRFVSFVTEASDIAPINQPGEGATSYSLIVCDRDPTNKHDAAGNPVLDLRQGNSTRPDYACYDYYSTASDGYDAIDVNDRPRLSGDGTHLVYTRDIDGSQTPRVYLARTAAGTGPVLPPATPAQVPAPTGYANETAPTVSRTAGRVVFRADRADSSGNTAIIEVDVNQTNINLSTSVRVDADPATTTQFLGDVNNPQTGKSVGEPAMSGDGTEVAFTFGTYESRQVYVATRTNDVFSSIFGSRNNDGGDDLGFQPALSQDGRYLAFVTDAFNMHDGLDQPAGGTCLDTGQANRTTCQVVAKDLVRDTLNELVSTDTNGVCSPSATGGTGCAADATSNDPSLDADGSEVGFDSLADDLITSEPVGPVPAAGNAYVHTWRSSLAASSTAFGAVKLGKHKDRTVTVTAQGFGPVSVGRTTVTGTDGTDFVVTASACAGKVLHDSDTCSLVMRFTPAGAGARTGTIAIATGKGGYPRTDPVLIQDLTGTGVKPKGPPAIKGSLAATPTSIDFGTVLPMAPGKTHIVTVTNTGGQGLTVTTIAIADGTVPGAHVDYTVINDGCTGSTLVAGSSCTFTVVLVGHAVGLRPAVVTIKDGAGGTVTVPVTALVAQPTLLANPGVVAPGRLTAITGAGFAPSRQVDISLAPFGDTTTATSDAKGNVTATLVLYSKVGTGPGIVTGQSHGLDPSVSAKTPLLVGLGSVEGPILVTRH